MKFSTRIWRTIHAKEINSKRTTEKEKVEEEGREKSEEEEEEEEEEQKFETTVSHPALNTSYPRSLREALIDQKRAEFASSWRAVGEVLGPEGRRGEMGGMGMKERKESEQVACIV